MRPIVIPAINNNDTEARLVEWLQPEGSTIRQGDPLAMLETSKATEELYAPEGGLLHLQAQPGQSYAYGSVIAHLFADAAELEQHRARRADPPPKPSDPGMVITQAAQRLIDQHHLTRDQLLQLGKKIIKADDLAPLLPPAPGLPSPASPLPTGLHQAAVARSVSRSHATIPQSFLVKKILCDKALSHVAALSLAAKVKVDLPDLLLHCVSQLPKQFPFFFGTMDAQGQFWPSDAGHIGVTFDLGTGLFIPVIRSASSLSLPDIGRKMMACRMKALRRSFTADDLKGGDLTISLNLDADTILVIPIILIEQTCMLTLSALQSEVALSSEGRPYHQRFVYLGVAFDHRVINGYEANLFLNAIKKQIEHPEEIGRADAPAPT